MEAIVEIGAEAGVDMAVVQFAIENEEDGVWENEYSFNQAN